MPKDNGEEGGLDPRDRILDAAVRLFSQKSYSATGMRELAAEAGVNLAMINYYFGSKQGLLKALINRFFEQYSEAVMGVVEDPGTLEENVRRLAKAIVDLFRRDPDMVRVAMTELPMDVPDLAEFKATRIRHLMGHLVPLVFPEIQRTSARPVEPHVLGPAFVSSISWHFMMRPVIERIFGIEFDDGFYDSFPDRIADLMLYGSVGIPPEGKGGT